MSLGFKDSNETADVFVGSAEAVLNRVFGNEWKEPLCLELHTQ